MKCKDCFYESHCFWLLKIFNLLFGGCRQARLRNGLKKKSERVADHDGTSQSDLS